jgi:hypothetical protein
MLENLIPSIENQKYFFNRNYGLKNLVNILCFNANLNSDLKNRIENLFFLRVEFNLKKNLLSIKKSNVSELVTLKTFSKMHSIPYFLNKRKYIC